jgi:hypothetical protein
VSEPYTSAWAHLPGAHWVQTGLAEIEAGRPDVAALLVWEAAPRLRGLGILIPPYKGEISPHHALYNLLAERYGNAAHGRFNAMSQEIVSFADAYPVANREAVLCVGQKPGK